MFEKISEIVYTSVDRDPWKTRRRSRVRFLQKKSSKGSDEKGEGEAKDGKEAEDDERMEAKDGGRMTKE